jgi:hypothetical protein
MIFLHPEFDIPHPHPACEIPRIDHDMPTHFTNEEAKCTVKPELDYTFRRGNIKDSSIYQHVTTSS